MATPGRVTTYKDENAEKAFALALLGSTDKEMAFIFGVTEKTFNNWKKKHPALVQAIKRGKDDADAAVSKSLYRRATGYEYTDTDIRVIDGVVVQTQVRKVQPPETVACIFWLKNRQLGKWRDKVEQDVKITQRSLAEELAELNANAKSDTAGH